MAGGGGGGGGEVGHLGKMAADWNILVVCPLV